MQRLRLFLTVSILVMLVVSATTVLAQDDSDGDGLPDRVDNCKDEAGPRENGGCPIADRDGDGVSDDVDECPGAFGPADNRGCPGIADSDGDGVYDDVDFCLHDPGPAENGGCPLPPDAIDDSQPEINLAPLPEIPPGGPCTVATLGHVPVNIRDLPWDFSAVVGAMDPYQLYPVNHLFENPLDETWYSIPGGYVASWVTRTGGQCRGLPVFSFAEDDDNTTLGEAQHFTLQLSDPILAPVRTDNFELEPEFVFPPGNWPFLDPPPAAHEHILLARFGPGGTDPEPIPVGLLLPAVQAALETAEQTSETQTVILKVVNYNPVGFNPQPDPPPGYTTRVSPDSIDPAQEPGVEGVWIVIQIEPGAAQDSDRDIPIELVSLNLRGPFPALGSCDGDGSVMPTAEMSCLYTSPMGDSALCTLGADDAILCMYGMAELPAVQ